MARMRKASSPVMSWLLLGADAAGGIGGGAALVCGGGTPDAGGA